MVQCVVNRLLSCPLVCGFCAWGAALGNARKVSTPPSPEGRYPASRRTRRSCRPPGRPCRESPGLFVLSLSHSSESNRQWVVNPPARLRGSRRVGTVGHRRLHPFGESVQMWTHAPATTSPRLIKRLRCRRVTDLKAAPSNASAASESTTAGSLEAFSQGIADAERFEKRGLSTPLESEPAVAVDDCTRPGRASRCGPFLPLKNNPWNRRATETPGVSGCKTAQTSAPPPTDPENSAPPGHMHWKRGTRGGLVLCRNDGDRGDEEKVLHFASV